MPARYGVEALLGVDEFVVINDTGERESWILAQPQLRFDLGEAIGGAAGQGIQTVGAILAQACRLGGLYALVVNDFESRIRGGHSFLQLRSKGADD